MPIAVLVVVLVAMRVAQTGGVAELGLQLLLIAAFAIVALLDLRVAVAIAVLELALGGASGQWTVIGSYISARIAMDGICLLVALTKLVPAAMTDRAVLGRYALHATFLGVLMPAVWMPLGLLNGNAPADVLGDGNGYAFLAFALVLPALALYGDLGWLRRWLLVSCAAVAVATLGIALAINALHVSGSIVQAVLFQRLALGGNLSVVPPGLTLRVYLGIGVYLQVGLILAVMGVLQRPRRALAWALVALFVIALAVTYTRGYWFAAAFGVLVLLLLSIRLRWILAIGFIGTVVFVSSLWVGYYVLHASYPVAVMIRIVSTFTIGQLPGQPDPGGPGDISNAIRAKQAQVLIPHIAERPILGWGFGTVAPDYPLGKIYSYELGYLDIAYKTGLIGLVLFLSFPLRLILDALRVRRGRLRGPPGLPAREAAVPVAVIASLLALGATNPYLTAAFGITPLLLMIAWLDPFGRAAERAPEKEPELTRPQSVAAGA